MEFAADTKLGAYIYLSEDRGVAGSWMEKKMLLVMEE